MEVFRIIYGVRGGFKCIQLNQANDGKLSVKSYVKDLDGLPGRSKRASLGKRGEASLNFPHGNFMGVFASLKYSQNITKIFIVFLKKPGCSTGKSLRFFLSL